MNSVELVNKINSLYNGKTLEIKEYDALLVNVGGYRGVGIVLKNDLFIDEQFNKVVFKTLKIEIVGEICDIIFLGMKENTLNPEYGWLCLDFLDSEQRDSILSNPLIWFRNWKELLGNSVKNKMIYDFIGEMKFLNILQKNGKNPKWDSVNKGTFDISCENEYFEVKSSQVKSQTEVTIHSQFQLDVDDGKNVNLVFVRVEQNDNGESIDSLYNELIKNGYNKQELDDYLTQNGYYAGKTERKVRYNILEIRVFKVDDNFPKITPQSFKNDQFPLGIKKIEYVVSLDGLNFSTMEEK